MQFRHLPRLAWRALPKRVRPLIRRRWEDSLSWGLGVLPPFRLRERLHAILEAHAGARGVIIYPPTVEWDYLFQRPQQMGRALARAGYLFFYCTRNAEADRVWGFRQVESNLYLSSAPLGVFDIVPEPILWLTWTESLPYLRYFPHARVVYDVIDDLSIFENYGPEAIARHTALIRRADVVLATAPLLLDSVRAIRPDAILCPNAADYDTFRVARRAGEPPDDLRPLVGRGRRILGYYGALAEWFDYDLVREVANRRPDWQWVLIGPDYDGSLRASQLRNWPGVAYLGRKSYASLPDYLRWFDVATIPFKVNQVTRAACPIKMFEYLAGGKPVVATALPECQRCEGVLTAATIEEFIAAVERALTLQADAAYLRTIDGLARENTWEARVAAVVPALEGAVNAARK